MKHSISSSQKCQFCCEVYQRNGEDPLGSLIQFDAWIIIELNQPWKYTIGSEPSLIPFHKQLLIYFKKFINHNKFS